MVFVAGIATGVTLACAAVLPLRWLQRRYAAYVRDQMSCARRHGGAKARHKPRDVMEGLER